MSRVLLATTFVFLTTLSMSCSAQQWKDDVGFTDLQNEIGAGLEDGTGVLASFVEAPPLGTTNYMPARASAENSGRFFVEGSGTSGTSSHSTNVGFRFYGNNSSMTPGLGRDVATPVTGFEAGDWLNNQLGFATGADPTAQPFHVSNHSYIAQVPDDLTESEALNILRRFDYVINQSEMTAVVGTNNGATNPVPELMVHSYNAISVGRSNGAHAAGLTTMYGAGRTKPEIVAPDSATSFSTPIVSGAAALLHQAGAGTDAVRTETLKAILLAGATKEEFADWDRTTTRPLDEVFGAGELNIQNSYHILQGGEFAGTAGDPASAVGEDGWAYEEEIVAGEELIYEFEVESGSIMDAVSIVLTWNMEITDLNDSPDVFDPSELLGDLNLEFFDSSNSYLGNLLDMSVSTVDNVEHIYLQDLDSGTYHLRVTSDTTRDFGLAWRSSFVSVPEPTTVTFGLGCCLIAMARRRRRA